MIQKCFFIFREKRSFFLFLGLQFTFAIAHSLGEIGEANQGVYDLKPELFNTQGADNFFTQKKWFSYQ